MSDPSAASPDPAAVPAPTAAPAPAPDPMGSVSPITALEALEDEAKSSEVDGDANEADTRPFVEIRGERFHLVSEVPGFVMLKLSAAADPRTPQAKQMSAVLAFLEQVVVDEEYDAFSELLTSARPPIDFEEINKLLTDASEAIGGRPTSQ